MDAQRALLDELMGSGRDLTEEERKGFKELSWDDKEVCRPFMIRFCPHDLFVNTKSDLGACPKIHDLKLKESFEKSPRHAEDVPKFEAELAQFCERLVTDLDRKIKRGRERLSQEVNIPPPSLTPEQAEQLSIIEDKIKKLLEQAETLGESGKIDEAEALMRKVDLLNAEKMALTKSTDKMLLLAQEKKMALCEICGAFLVANDAVERTQAHVTGKQHIGYSMVRDFIAEHKEAKDKAREKERLNKEKELEERRKAREENENRGKRDRSRDRDLERERHREWRGSSYKQDGYRERRDYSRERNHSQSLSRSRGRRSPSPARHHHYRRRISRSPA